MKQFFFQPFFEPVLKFLSCVLVSFIIATLTGCASGPKRTLGTWIDDQSANIQARTRLFKNKQITKNSHISMMTYNHSILLVGQAPNARIKEEAVNVLSDIPSTHRIYNEITVGKPISVLQQAKDTFITSRVKLRLMANKELSASNIKVITEDGVVYLMGLISPDQADLATDVARSVPKIRRVVKIFDNCEN